MLVTYSRTYGSATIQGPGGFTQILMSELSASSLAYAIGARFEVQP